jgi:hypothetical protein
MSISAVQLIANQNNAKKSTGPVTVQGKQTVANNALKHGVFSKSLILSDEDPAEYKSLLDQLLQELHLIGLLEQTLVERIALTLWRQRRLVRAETANIESGRSSKQIVLQVNQELELSYSSHELKESDLIPFDAMHYEWCESILSELDGLFEQTSLDLIKIKNIAPNVYQQLQSDAQDLALSPVKFLQDFEQPFDYFDEIRDYCLKEIQKKHQHQMVSAVAELVKSKSVILKEKLRDSLCKYQIMLDNELYKAMKALRDAQEWRMQSYIVADVNGFVVGMEVKG